MYQGIISKYSNAYEIEKEKLITIQ